MTNGALIQTFTMCSNVFQLRGFLVRVILSEIFAPFCDLICNKRKTDTMCVT